MTFPADQASLLVKCSSPNESITTCIERTLTTQDEQTGHHRVTFLPQSPAAMDANQFVQDTTRASESRAITRILGNPDASTHESATPEVQIDLMSESSFKQPKVECFRNHTSDVEDLLNSSGAETCSNQATLIGPGFQTATKSESIVLPKSGIKEITASSAMPHPSSPSRQISASGRSAPISFPMGHPTIAFSGRRIHNVFDHFFVSNDEIRSRRSDTRWAQTRVGTRVQCSSIGKSSQGQDNVGRYTNGALSSDDEFHTFDSQGARAAEDLAPHSKPNSSSEPLAELRQTTHSIHVTPSPSRKNTGFLVAPAKS